MVPRVLGQLAKVSKKKWHPLEFPFPEKFPIDPCPFWYILLFNSSLLSIDWVLAKVMLLCWISEGVNLSGSSRVESLFPIAFQLSWR